MPSTLLLPLPLPADSVKIGSFLVNPCDPTQEYFDPQEEDPGLKPSILRVDATDFTNTIQDAGTKEVEAILTGYFSTTINWAKSKSLELSSAKAATYLMRNSGSWFEQACALDPMRSWFEWVTNQGHKTYLLVGLRTIFDGRFKIEHSASTITGGQVKVPTDMLAGLPPIGLDVGGGGKVSKDQSTSSEFSAAGERIWALQYRQIKFKWYSSKKMENAALETGTRWATTHNWIANPRRSYFSTCHDKGYPTKDTAAAIQWGYPVAARSDVQKPPVEGKQDTARKTRYNELYEDRPVASQGRYAVADWPGKDVEGMVAFGVRDEDVVEAFMDDELDLEDQFEVQDTNGETLFIPREGEDWVPLSPPSYKMAQREKHYPMPSWVPLPPHLKTAADDPEEDVQLSNDASVSERAGSTWNDCLIHYLQGDNVQSEERRALATLYVKHSLMDRQTFRSSTTKELGSTAYLDK